MVDLVVGSVSGSGLTLVSAKETSQTCQVRPGKGTYHSSLTSTWASTQRSSLMLVRRTTHEDLAPVGAGQGQYGGTQRGMAERERQTWS